MITISCLCGAARQSLLIPPHQLAAWQPAITFCHCDTCRHLTGVLCTSYVPIPLFPSSSTNDDNNNNNNNSPSLVGLRRYSPTEHSSRYFCATCGCHVFRSIREDDGNNGAVRWEVATGVVIDSPPFSSFPPVDSVDSTTTTTTIPTNQLSKTKIIHQHLHIKDTLDGGLSGWLPDSPSHSHPHPTSISSISSGGNSTTTKILPAACHCGRIAFNITRPTPESALPHSNFSDLLVPYCDVSMEVVRNPLKVKWWLREGSSSLPSTAGAGIGAGVGVGETTAIQNVTDVNKAGGHSSTNNTLTTQSQSQDRDLTQEDDNQRKHNDNSNKKEDDEEKEIFSKYNGYKYLAGTCACRSCRLISGFEIQTWTFVPRCNILMDITTINPSSPPFTATATSSSPIPIATTAPTPTVTSTPTPIATTVPTPTPIPASILASIPISTPTPTSTPIGISVPATIPASIPASVPTSTTTSTSTLATIPTSAPASIQTSVTTSIPTSTSTPVPTQDLPPPSAGSSQLPKQSVARDHRQATIPLDFAALPPGLLSSYRSSANAVREFCPGCGATVFWHDGDRPDLIDVSVGLLRCPLGTARAESYLEWWTERVSFSEEARTGRSGGMADWAETLVHSLENNMRGVKLS